MNNPAAALYGAYDVRMEDWPIEEPKHGEVQVRVHSVGICGTDIHHWKSGTIFDQSLTSSKVLGHETSAEVIKAGSGVTEFKPGDRVHLYPARACHVCECCRAGKEYNCQVIKLGTRNHGHLRRICNHRAEYLYRLPDNLSHDEGALIEPWVVGVYAVERSGLLPGSKCVIVGAGAIGAMVYLAAELAGANGVVVVDISQPKLDLIAKLGSCKTLLASKDPKETARNVEELLGSKTDVAFDATCTQPGITTAIYSAKPCSKVILAGLAPDNCTLPMQHCAINEIDILNVLRYGHCYPRAFDIIKSGRVNLKKLVADRYPLMQTEDALKATSDGLVTGFKTIVDCTL